MSKPVIFVFAQPTDPKRGMDQQGAEDQGVENFYGDVCGTALSCDGEVLTGHLSSSMGWFRNDMGLTGTRKHDEYKKKYPQGYELVEVSYPPTGEGFQKAVDLYLAMKKESL